VNIAQSHVSLAEVGYLV